MPRLLRLAAAVFALALLPALGAFAAPDDTATLQPGESYTWEAVTAGTNVNYFGIAAPAEPVAPIGQCSKNPNSYCDSYLIELSNPLTQADIDAGKTFLRRTVTVTINFSASDMDLQVWNSDAEGTRGTQLGQSAGSDFTESVAASIRTTEEAPSQWILVDVIHFAHAGPYDGAVQF
jgi:hypothetical protein